MNQLEEQIFMWEKNSTELTEKELFESPADKDFYGRLLNLDEDPHTINAAKRKKKDEDEDDDVGEEEDDFYEEEEEEDNPFDAEPSEDDLIEDDFPDEDDDLFDDEEDEDSFR